MNITDEELIKSAYEAKGNAYAKYSDFHVGAALLTRSGKVYKGCNIENSSYGATICAERTAIFKAVSEGERDFVCLAIVSDKKDATYPCGICRQVMTEFMSKDFRIITDNCGKIEKFTLSEMLPMAFSLD